MVDVFISYTRTDRAQIKSLARVLEDDGYSVWWDHSIAGGAAFAAEIERALNDAKAVVVAWSVSGVQSDWVLDEASTAKQAGKLVPIGLDATLPPIGFRQYQVVDFSAWSGERDAGAIAALTQSIDRFLHRDAPTARIDLPPESVPSAVSAIAVLPLENFSGDSGQQFFVDGMHEALIAELSKIGALKVISRTSTRVYSGSTKPLREIAAELGVTKIVEGSVIRVENDVRITIRLIDARTDTNLWAESFDRDMSNILRLQQEAARAIAEKINVALTPAEESRLAGAPQVRPEAYEAYLKGMFHWYKLTPQDLQSALQCFDAALAADPDYAPAYAGIAAAWAGIQQMGAERPAVAGPRMKSAVDKALELDANLSQAHFTYGMYYTWTAWDWAKAESSFQRAIELNPNFPDAYAYYSHYLNITGRFDEAETQVERALDLDPFNPLVRALYACDLMFWERYDEAIEQLQSVLNVAPDHWLAFQAIRFPYHYRNMYNDALGATRSLYVTLGNSAVVEALDRGSAEGGYRVALARAGDALAKQAETTFVLPTQIAILYGMADEVDRTAIWIEKAYEAGDPELPYLKYLRRFPPSVMDDPRVKEIVTRMNYPPKL